MAGCEQVFASKILRDSHSCLHELPDYNAKQRELEETYDHDEEVEEEEDEDDQHNQSDLNQDENSIANSNYDYDTSAQANNEAEHREHESADEETVNASDKNAAFHLKNKNLVASSI